MSDAIRFISRNGDISFSESDHNYASLVEVGILAAEEVRTASVEVWTL